MSKGKNARKRQNAQQRAQQKFAQSNSSLGESIDTEYKGSIPKEPNQNSNTEREVPVESGKLVYSIRKFVGRSSFTDWCLTFFTLAISVIAYYQLTVMKNDERAWIRVGSPIENPPDQFTVEPDKPIIFPTTISNIGKTAARNVHGKVFIDLLQSGQEVSLGCVDSDTCPATELTTGIIFPTDFTTGAVILVTPQRTIRNATQAEAEAWKAGNNYIAVYGIVTYDDVFGVSHWTKFCLWKGGNSKSTYMAQNCAKYSEVDNQ